MESLGAQISVVRKLHAPVVHVYESLRHADCAHCRETVEGESAEVDWPCDTARIVYTEGEIDAVVHNRPHANPAECPARIDVTPYPEQGVKFICGCKTEEEAARGR